MNPLELCNPAVHLQYDQSLSPNVFIEYIGATNSPSFLVKICEPLNI